MLVSFLHCISESKTSEKILKHFVPSRHKPYSCRNQDKEMIWKVLGSEYTAGHYPDQHCLLTDWCFCHNYCCISQSPALPIDTSTWKNPESYWAQRYLLAEQTTVFKPLQTRPTWLHFKTLRVQSFYTCPKKNINLLSIAHGWFWNHMRYCIKAFGNVITNTASWVYKTSGIPRLFLNSKLPVVDKPCLLWPTMRGHMTDIAGPTLIIIPD